MNYAQQRAIAIALSIIAGAITLIQASNGEALGLPPIVLAWLGILNGVLALALGFLPNVRGTDQQPAHIANRIMELTPAERKQLLTDLDQRGLDTVEV